MKLPSSFPHNQIPYYYSNFQEKLPKLRFQDQHSVDKKKADPQIFHLQQFLVNKYYHITNSSRFNDSDKFNFIQNKELLERRNNLENAFCQKFLHQKRTITLNKLNPINLTRNSVGVDDKLIVAPNTNKSNHKTSLENYWTNSLIPSIYRKAFLTSIEEMSNE